MMSGRGLRWLSQYLPSTSVPVPQWWLSQYLHETDQRFPMVTSQNEKLLVNPDGSVDIYFGLRAPAGKENSGVQTVPGKGWNTLFRLYGPLEPWFDKTWRPGEIEAVDWVAGRPIPACSGRREPGYGF